MRVLIVEDELLIARNIERSLERIGHEVLAVCSQGAEVYAALEEHKARLPELVLMDIHLDNNEDGVDLAEQLQRRYGLHVIFLSALMDKQTIERAKITQPFAYILKPFSQRELAITLEMARYRIDVERRLFEQEVHIQSIIDSMEQGFCLLDNELRFRYVNRKLAAMLGQEARILLGQPAEDYLALPRPGDSALWSAWSQERPFEIGLGSGEGQRRVLITARHLEQASGGIFLSITDLHNLTRA